MKLIIINGTLCTDALWNDYSAALKSLLGIPLEIVFADITKQAHSIDDYAQAIGTSIVQDTDEPVFVLGYSFGGIIGLELVKRYQQYIAGMLLVCTNHYGQTREKQETVKRQLALLDEEGLEAVFHKILLPAYFGEELGNYRKEADVVLQMALSLGEEVYRNQLYTLGTRIDQSAYLANITLPILLCYGEQDVLCTEAQNKEMHAHLPQSTLHTIAHTRHMVPLLCAKELAEVFLQFLGKVAK